MYSMVVVVVVVSVVMVVGFAVLVVYGSICVTCVSCRRMHLFVVVSVIVALL